MEILAPPASRVVSCVQLSVRVHNDTPYFFTRRQSRNSRVLISRAVNLIYVLSALVHPFMPSTSTEMLRQLNAPARTVPSQLSNDLLAGHEIGTPGYLFKKIEEKNADVWRLRFSGVQVNAAAVEKVSGATGEATTKPSKRAAAKQQKETVVVAPSGPKSSEELELEKEVKAQGDKVRRIKGGHVEEGDGSLEEAIAQLKQLKLNLQELASTHT